MTVDQIKLAHFRYVQAISAITNKNAVFAITNYSDFTNTYPNITNFLFRTVIIILFRSFFMLLVFLGRVWLIVVGYLSKKPYFEYLIFH